mgnify:CR=1 FL=1
MNFSGDYSPGPPPSKHDSSVDEPAPTSPPKGSIRRIRRGLLALQHCAKSVLGGNLLPRTLAILASWLPVAESEPNKEALAHRVVTIRHGLESLLLLVHLFVFGHVSFAAEIVKVASVRLRIELRDERCASLAQSFPVDFAKVLMVADVLKI